MDGICSSEPEILQKLDKNLAVEKSVESFAVTVKYSAKGTFSSNSKVANQKEFAIMMEYVQDKAKKIGREILKGNTSVNPFEWKKENACEYCPYKEICGFDEKLPGYECEFVLVNDYSKDGTFASIKELCGKYPFVKGINLSRNFGSSTYLCTPVLIQSRES